MSPPPRFSHVMLATDLGRGQSQPYVHALRIALAARGRLDLVHAKPSRGHADWSTLPTVKQKLTSWGYLSEADPSGDYEALGLHVHAETEDALDPLPALVQHALRARPDLLVLGTETRSGLEVLARYSVSEHVARASGIPALFIARGNRGFVDPVTGQPRLTRLLVPVGGHLPLQQAIAWTTALLDLFEVQQAEITLLHVGEDWQGELEVPARPGWIWEPLARPGLVVPVILEAATERTPDLIVMVTQGGTGLLRGFVGSNMEKVLHQARCPVLAIPV